MGKYMKRNVYDQMLRWKQRPEHTTLEVSGARQTGKTYIVNKFADEQYIVIIDEIQESAAIYNRIREFTRRLKSDFIITGSYLGLTSYFLTHIGCPESAVRQRLQQWAIVYAKGNTHGGVKDQVFTIPVYGIGKFEF